MQKRTILISLLVFFLLVLLIYFSFFREQAASDYLILHGNVDVRQVDLGFRTNGRVVEMPFQEGDFVSQGTFMGRIDKQPYIDLVRQQEASVESLKYSLANSEKILKRREGLVGGGGVSDEDYQNALNSKDVYSANLRQAEAALSSALTDLRDTEVFAPSDGTILTRIREPGSVVREGDPIYTLSLISPIWVRAFVSEPQLGNVYPGMAAEIYTDTKGEPVSRGHVGFISPVAEFTPKTVETNSLRTDLVFRLRIIADNPDWGLRQGMPVTVRLRLRNRDQETK